LNSRASADCSISDATQWDAICVGSGISSLAFGALLAVRQPSMRLLIIEKHVIPGGYATWFKRPKHASHFDCSLHKLSGMGRTGNLKNLLYEIGAIGELDFVFPEEYFRMHFGADNIRLPNDDIGAEKVLIDRFSNEAVGIKQFFEDVRTHGRNGYLQHLIMQGKVEPDFNQMRYAHRFLKKRTLQEKLDELFTSTFLKATLSCPALYVGAFPDQISYLYYLHVVYATLVERNAYVRGTSQRLSNYLVQKILGAGGDVLLNCAAKNILTDENGTVLGVETTRGRFLSSKVYINAAPKYALENLFQENQALEPVRERIRGLTNSNSTTTLYLVLHCDPADAGITCTEQMVLDAGFSEVDFARSRTDASLEIMQEAYWNDGPLEVTNYFKLDPEGGYVVAANVLDSIEHWPMRKTPAYHRKKALAQATLLQRLCRAWPRMTSKVRYCEVSSPRTYQRYTNNDCGAGYGALVGANLMGHGFHYGFPIDGVHFLSSWVAGPGYEAAFGYADLQANLLMTASTRPGDARLPRAPLGRSGT
jgi:all-trans-retinol 13,14-reductase